MKKLWWLGLVMLLAGGSLAWAEEKIIDPKTLEGKTLEEIYLMRNEIYARHGKPFKTYELHTYFRSQKWYKLDTDYNDSRLSKTDWANISTLKAKGQELLKQNYIIKDGQQRINFNNVINRRQFGRFSHEEIEKLSAHGFLVVDPRNPEHFKKAKEKKTSTEEDYGDENQPEQFFYLYDNNNYRGIASFITTDSLLQLYHVFFDFTLRNLEKDKLYPLLQILTSEMLKQTRTFYKETKNPQLKEAAWRNIAYFEVAQYFLTGNLPKIEPSLTNIVLGEIDKCQKHTGRQNSLIFNPNNDPNIKHLVDYTQFVPRGHYTNSKELQRYFMAMMWFSSNIFEADKDMELLQSLLITHLLYEKTEEKELYRLWGNIYEPTVFYVGVSNDLGPLDYIGIMYKVFNENQIHPYDIKNLIDKAKLERVNNLIIERYHQKQRIKIEMWGIPQGPQFRFMGQRFIPDSYILQRLSTYPQKPGDPFRAFPKGLDVMAVLGSQEAKKILLEEYKEGEFWHEYPNRLDQLMKEFRELHPDDWHQNLYYNWLWTLKSLIELSQEFKYPFFMKNETWGRKSLNTALASWAELRHDTILYGQASGAEAGDGGDDWVPDPPKSYVEPNIIFYNRLGELLTFTQEGLHNRDLLTPKMKERFVWFRDMVSFLERAAIKELNGELLTNREYSKIQAFGGWLENLTLSVITDDEHIRWFELKSETDKNIAVIADVHTSLNQVLEVGVGPAFEIYVVVDMGGHLKLTRGAVFSYYEFIHPASDRLTDAKWQQMLKEGKEPPLPPWANIYLSPQKGHEFPIFKFYYPSEEDKQVPKEEKYNIFILP